MRGFQPQYVPGPAERGRGNGLTTEDINMRRLRYSVAMSLDGFIAGAKGEYDWIIMDPTIDFAALYKEFDTALMGRKTFEMARQGPGATMPGMKTIVCSRTLLARDFPDVTITSD